MFRDDKITDEAWRFVQNDEDYEVMKGRHHYRLMLSFVYENYYDNLMCEYLYYESILNYTPIVKKNKKSIAI